MLGKDTAFSLKQGNLYRDFIAFSMQSPCFGTSSWQYFRRMVLHRKGLPAKSLPINKRAGWLAANGSPTSKTQKSCVAEGFDGGW